MRIGTGTSRGTGATVTAGYSGMKPRCRLLAEVPYALTLDGSVTWSTPMAATKAWAAVWSLGGGIGNFPSPHSAAAAAVQDDVLFCSCVLPWPSARGWWPDEGEDLAVITATTLAQLAEDLVLDLSIVSGRGLESGLDGQCVGTRHGWRDPDQLDDQLGHRGPRAICRTRVQTCSVIDQIAMTPIGA